MIIQDRLDLLQKRCGYTNSNDSIYANMEILNHIARIREYINEQDTTIAKYEEIFDRFPIDIDEM